MKASQMKSKHFNSKEAHLLPAVVAKTIQDEVGKRFQEWENKQPYPFAMPNKKLMVPTPDGLRFIELSKIIYFKAEGSYTYLFLMNNEKMIVSAHLKQFDDRLKQPPFVRTHRSYIVNINHAAEYLRGRKGFLVMSNGHRVEISVRKRESFSRIMSTYFY